MNESIIVRDATNEDLGAIRELVHRCLAEFGLEMDYCSSDEDLLDLEATYGTGFFLAAFDHKGLVATAGVHRESETEGKLRKMYIDYRFRGIGLGRRMLNECLARSRSMGLRTLRLETTHQMKVAQHLYESAGFEEIADSPTSPRCHRTYQLRLE
jgi:ribosomal protein S18 acetylase RimI-like enzyme